MPRYDLAGNPLPETDGSPPPETLPAPHLSPPVPPARPLAPRPAAAPPRQLVFAPAPPQTPSAPPAPHAILTRGIVQETPAQKARAYAGLAATFLLLIALTYAVAAIPSPRIPAPASYTPYTSQSATLTCDAPTGWKQEEDADSLSFSLQQAHIEIDAPPTDAVAASRSAADLHAQTQDQLADSLDGDHFQEQAAQPLTSRMGDAVISQWSAASGLTHLAGYRATLMSGNDTAEVVCVCPQRDWATLQPAFLHVIQSLAPTTSAGTQTGGAQP